MKKLIISLLVVAAFVAAPVSLFAQEGTTLSTAAKANVVNALTLVTNAGGDAAGQSLNFGSITPGNTGGSVIMAPNTVDGIGLRSATGTVDLIGTVASCALYTVTGTSGATYTITLPTSDVTLNGPAGGTVNTMTLNAFTMNVSGTLTTASTATGTLTSGTSKFAVGGTLSVAGNQDEGAYTGTFPVTVNYN